MILRALFKKTVENVPKEETDGVGLPATEKESGVVPQPECSIYEYIRKHTKNGGVDADFRIPWLQGNWAPGAQDGVFLYHMAPLQPDPDREQKILKALTMMSDEESGQYTGEIFAIFDEIEEKTSSTVWQNSGSLP